MFSENKHFQVFLLENKTKLLINTMFCTAKVSKANKPPLPWRIMIW